MGCFSLQFLENVFIWLVVIGAIYALINLLLPLVFANFGGPGNIVLAALRIILWAVICIAIIIFVFDLISCLLGMGGTGSLGLRLHGRG